MTWEGRVVNAVEIRNLAFAIVLAVMAILWWMGYVHGQQTPNEWFNLAVAIQNQRHQLDDEETRFIANVVNRLTVSEDAMPTPEHKKWLLSLKQRLKIR